VRLRPDAGLIAGLLRSCRFWHLRFTILCPLDPPVPCWADRPCGDLYQKIGGHLTPLSSCDWDGFSPYGILRFVWALCHYRGHRQNVVLEHEIPKASLYLYLGMGWLSVLAGSGRCGKPAPYGAERFDWRWRVDLFAGHCDFLPTPALRFQNASGTAFVLTRPSAFSQRSSISL